jgi:chromosome segregation ATPase
MSKQDRIFVRTPTGLDQKYDFGKAFSDLEQVTKNQGKQITTQGNAFSQYQEHTDLRLGNLEGRMTNAENDVAFLETDVKNLKQRMTTAEHGISNLEGRMKTAEQNVVALGNRATSSENRISALENQMGTLTMAVTELSHKVSSAENAITALEARVLKLEAASEA